MGHDDNRVVEADQELFQPFDRVQVQVVRRLVEKQDVGVAEQCLCEQDLHLDRSVELLHPGVMKLFPDAEAVEERLRVRFGFPAVHLRKFSLQLGCAYTVFIGEILLHVDRILFLHHFIEPPVAHDDRVKDVIVIIFEMVLLEE